MSEPTVGVRRLEPTDREAVRELHEICFEDDLAFNDLVLDRLFRHQHAINLVAEIDDELAGYACAIHGGRPKARLLTLQTHPDARGQGVATRLMDELTTRLVARKAKLLELEVHVDNEPAIELYRKLGFEIEREDGTAYPSMAEPTGYVMHKPLDTANS